MHGVKIGLSEQVRNAFLKRAQRGLTVAEFHRQLQARGHEIDASGVHRKLHDRKPLSTEWCQAFADTLEIRIVWDGRRAS